MKTFQGKPIKVSRALSFIFMCVRICSFIVGAHLPFLIYIKVVQSQQPFDLEIGFEM